MPILTVALQMGLAMGLAARAGPAAACETALLLAIDVSSSIDRGEFGIQVDGLADALADPEVIEALVAGQSALAVVQWSGVNKQQMVMDWHQMKDAAAVAEFAAAARTMPRRFADSDTAIGDAIDFAGRQFAAMPSCRRKVIDISGDGPQNAGTDARLASQRAERAGIIINGIAIESIGIAMTSYYRRTIVTTHGFVVTARGHLEYPRAIRQKILRELARAIG